MKINPPDEPYAPFITRLATAIPQRRTVGTQTATLIRNETTDEDTDYDNVTQVPAQLPWERQGAFYDSIQGLWIKNSQPFVLLQHGALDTETLTKTVKEEADEDQ